jgi:hypothetical protein
MVECPLLALSGHPPSATECPVSGYQRTSPFESVISALDPKRTLEWSILYRFLSYRGYGVADRAVSSKRPGIQSSFLTGTQQGVRNLAPKHVGRKGTYMRFQYTSLKSKPPMLQPINPCPVCSAETSLAEIEPHPLHANFEIHGYLCDRCGPTKSLIVLRKRLLHTMM